MLGLQEDFNDESGREVRTFLISTYCGCATGILGTIGELYLWTGKAQPYGLTTQLKHDRRVAE